MYKPVHGKYTYDVVGYTYDADIYCERCIIFVDQSFVDRTKGKPYPIFADDEFDYQPMCSNCLGAI